MSFRDGLDSLCVCCRIGVYMLIALIGFAACVVVMTSMAAASYVFAKRMTRQLEEQAEDDKKWIQWQLQKQKEKSERE